MKQKKNPNLIFVQKEYIGVGARQTNSLLYIFFQQ